ncbi:hypothetical protein [Kitasatospora sp. NPDC085879]|jgi:hypothetical protein|uniref:hypothetical protein n=1 Tax=Kitasatospora sp. NPDC085879 TaxID=3154769 RepID=UPI0034154830
MAYRYWCGECGFKTAWLGESQGEQRLVEHYAKQHPGIRPGGQVESRRKRPDGGSGCALVVGLVVLMLILAAVYRR